MQRHEVVGPLAANLSHALIALDFDGTLAPIVRDPAASRPTAGAVDTLIAMARAGARIAVITGRDAATALDLGGFAAIPGVVVAGLYGAEFWHAGELDSPGQPQVIDELRAELPGAIADVDDDIWIEDKRLSLVVHARRAARPEAAIEGVRPAVEALAARLGLETHDGKGVLEVRLPGYDKGAVLRELVARFEPSVVLFAGDDLGDVPAFEAVRVMRGTGLLAFGVAVAGASENPEAVEAADLRVNDPAEFVDLLGDIART
jgi:trehalose 6-phosphate phosphatase